MRRDRHYAAGEFVPHWARHCKHCGRPMKTWGLVKYGSNACRQAAYRLRLTLAEIEGCSPNELTNLGHTRFDQVPNTSPPSVETIIERRRRRQRVTRPSRKKGGAA